MKILGIYGKEDLAKVYVAQMGPNSEHLIEFVESTQPPIPLDKKWVLIVSSMYGCPVGCKMCDAGGNFHGKMRTEEIIEQIDYLVNRRFPDGRIPIPKFKIQFARMGEPSLNSNVLEALERLPQIYDAPGLIPSVSTVAPSGRNTFFNRLTAIKDEFYSNGRFQLQFSIHTTDKKKRDELIPFKKLSFEEISEYGKKFHKEGDKKLTLNFAAAKGYVVDPKMVRRYFDPDLFLIKLTPLNPTVRVQESKLESVIVPSDSVSSNILVSDFQEQGFDVILSIGEVEENRIGSNCGQFVSLYKSGGTMVKEAYDTHNYQISSS